MVTVRGHRTGDKTDMNMNDTKSCLMHTIAPPHAEDGQRDGVGCVHVERYLKIMQQLMMREDRVPRVPSLACMSMRVNVIVNVHRSIVRSSTVIVGNRA